MPGLAFAVITFCVRVYTRSGFNPHLMRAPSLIEALVLHTEPYFIVFAVRALSNLLLRFCCVCKGSAGELVHCFCDAMGLASGKNELYQRKAVHC